MSTPTLLAAPPAAPAASRTGLAALVVAAILLAAHLPLLIAHGQQLWLRPHYRFFPLVLLGAGVLAFTRLRPAPALAPGSTRWAAPLLLLAWCLLAAAELLHSSWLGSISALTTLAALGYTVGGVPLLRRLWPAWLLLWLAVPPPLELDRNLILWLQGWTTRWSSAVLDALGVWHVMAGNVVEVDEQRLLVEGACSGINSLFSVLACTLFVVLLAQRPLVRSLLLLGAAVGWVLVANVTRVVGVAWLLTRGIDVSAGWRHDAFGLALFAAAVLLIVSTDQLLNFLFLPSGSRSRVEDDFSLDSPPYPAARLRWPAVLAGPAFLLLLAGHVSVYGWGADQGVEGEAARAALDTLDADTLPPRLDPWQRQEFQTQTRDAGSFFGERSWVWRYRHRGSTALFSLDAPFPAWHDLTRCYTSQGWRLDDQEVVEDRAVPGGFVAVQLSKPAYRSGYLLFCAFNHAGAPLQARRGGAHLSLYRHESALRAWQSWLGGREAGPVDPPGPVYQWQLLVETAAPLPPAERAELHKTFARSFAALRRELR
jgi:exosortase